jgi:hypothetical protein
MFPTTTSEDYRSEVADGFRQKENAERRRHALPQRREPHSVRIRVFGESNSVSRRRRDSGLS